MGTQCSALLKHDRGKGKRRSDGDPTPDRALRTSDPYHGGGGSNIGYTSHHHKHKWVAVLRTTSCATTTLTGMNPLPQCKEWFSCHAPDAGTGRTGFESQDNTDTRLPWAPGCP